MNAVLDTRSRYQGKTHYWHEFYTTVASARKMAREILRIDRKYSGLEIKDIALITPRGRVELMRNGKQLRKI